MGLNITKEVNQIKSVLDFYNKKEDATTEVKDIEIQQTSSNKKTLQFLCSLSYVTKYRGKIYHCSCII
jgi:hypothetical protein